MINTNSTVAVFGGSGFVGSHVIRRIAERGAVIRVITRNPRSAYALKPSGTPGQITAIGYSPSDELSIQAAVQGCSHVVNLVGILAETHKTKFTDVHVLLAERIAQAAAICGVKSLVHISALGANEKSPSAYQRSKAAGEIAVLKAFPRATILRPSIIFGPNDGFFTLFAKMAYLNPVLPLIGGGKTRFQPVFVGDVANAVCAGLTMPETRGQTYELVGPETYSFKDLLRLILKATNRKRLLVPLPFPVAMAMGRILQHLPKKLLTADQVRSLQTDNVASGKLPSLSDLHITPSALGPMLPDMLEHFRPGGMFGKTQKLA